MCQPTGARMLHTVVTLVEQHWFVPMIQGVAHTGRRLPIGVTAVSTGCLDVRIAERVPHDALLYIYPPNICRYRTRHATPPVWSPPITDMTSESRLPAYLFVRTVRYQRR